MLLEYLTPLTMPLSPRCIERTGDMVFIRLGVGKNGIFGETIRISKWLVNNF